MGIGADFKDCGFVFFLQVVGGTIQCEERQMFSLRLSGVRRVKGDMRGEAVILLMESQSSND